MQPEDELEDAFTHAFDYFRGFSLNDEGNLMSVTPYMLIDLGMKSVQISFQWDPKNILVSEIRHCKLPPKPTAMIPVGSPYYPFPSSGCISVGSVMLFVHAFYAGQLSTDSMISLITNENLLIREYDSSYVTLLINNIRNLQYRDVINNMRFDKFEKIDDGKYRVILKS